MKVLVNPYGREASRARLAGESIDEVAFLLGHRDANVTRAVYLRELSDARCRAMRRSQMTAQFRGFWRLLPRRPGPNIESVFRMCNQLTMSPRSPLTPQRRRVT